MARLLRSDLFTIAKKHGWVKGTPLSTVTRTAILNELRGKLVEADTAPTRVFEADGSFRPMTIKEAADNLLEELV